MAINLDHAFTPVLKIDNLWTGHKQENDSYILFSKQFGEVNISLLACF